MGLGMGMRMRAGTITQQVICETGVLLVVCAGGCARKQPGSSIVKLEEIKHVAVFAVDPSRHSEAYTQSVDDLKKTYKEADFNTDVFCRYVKSSQYSVELGAYHRGGNLLIVLYEDGTEERMLIAYYGSLRGKKKGHLFTSDDGIAQDAFKQEHKRIVEEVFISQRQ